MLTRYPFLAFALLFTLAACASTGSSSRSGGSADTITREQIDESTFSNAYELVQALRANWLRKQGSASVNNPSDVVVYLDRSRYGGPRSLRDISTNNIERITRLSPTEASSRYGLDHVHGAIVVETRSGR